MIMMRIATAPLSLAALLALAGPAFAGVTDASTFWERQRSQPTKEGRPYALTGDARRSTDEGFKMCIGWVGANRDRRPIYKRN
jgi:hypothetical protein